MTQLDMYDLRRIGDLWKSGQLNGPLYMRYREDPPRYLWFKKTILYISEHGLDEPNADVVAVWIKSHDQGPNQRPVVVYWKDKYYAGTYNPYGPEEAITIIGELP